MTQQIPSESAQVGPQGPAIPPVPGPGAVVKKILEDVLTIPSRLQEAVIGAPNREAAKELCRQGKAFGIRRQYETAAYYFELAREIDPMCLPAQYYAAVCAGRQGNYDRQITCFTNVLSLASFAPAFCGRGDALISKGCYEPAIADLSEAVRLVPRYALAYHFRGCARRCLGETEQAKADFRVAEELWKSGRAEVPCEP
jgi:tetratricopeptide (TPR) repeat protein